MEKSYSLTVIEQVLTELGAHGYLDDAAFAREWRRHREERRPRGQGVLRQELLRLGVEPEVIQEALAGFDAIGNAYHAALALAQRLTGSDYPQFRKRIWSHLQRRGFDHSVISDVVSQLWRQLADPLNGRIDAQGEEQQGNGESEVVDRRADDKSAQHGTTGDPGQRGASLSVDCPANELANTVTYADGGERRDEWNSAQDVDEEGP